MVLRLIAMGAFALSVVFAVTVQAANRVALVIGNSSYTQVAPLRNPKNDARALAAKLEDLDFQVVSGIDLDRRGFIKKIREFSKISAGADVALFFYAGHGLQVSGSNYLVPVDATIGDETDLEFEAIDLSAILKVMEREDRINLVFLDACRDNPMSRSLSRSMGTRSAAVGRGLAPLDSGSGTLIGFATQPGNVALDGEGTVNSPFTSALLKHIDTPNLDVAQLMRRVRKDVKAQTNGRQIPWTNESLTEDFAFNRVDADAIAPKVVATAKQPVQLVLGGDAAQQADLALWNAVKDSNDPAMFQGYLDQFETGLFAFVARSKLQSLTSRQIAIVNKPAAPVIPEPDREPVKLAINRSALMLACDEAAMDPFNNDNPSRVAGVSDRKIDPEITLAACGAALEETPNDLRALYQFARGYYKTGLYKDAAKFVQRAAHADYAPAMVLLALMHDDGNAFPKNKEVAAIWIRKAAEAGYGRGQFIMGILYLEDDAVQYSETEAIAWFQKAAAQGNADAQEQLEELGQ
ncbi:MAG: caspase family protein [Cohaesibacteraceae bacterium]|nr:caspase family protein [Cohaesibacteraceae bacterium]